MTKVQIFPLPSAANFTESSEAVQHGRSVSSFSYRSEEFAPEYETEQAWTTEVVIFPLALPCEFCGKPRKKPAVSFLLFPQLQHRRVCEEIYVAREREPPDFRYFTPYTAKFAASLWKVQHGAFLLPQLHHRRVCEGICGAASEGGPPDIRYLIPYAAKFTESLWAVQHRRSLYSLMYSTENLVTDMYRSKRTMTTRLLTVSFPRLRNLPKT